MGVHHLWSILTSVGKQTALSDLVGKTLAVDLSGWVCQALNCRPMSATVQKPHLRNLFFRIHHMYRLGINLVFVVDGEATKMKWKTMDKRARAESDHDVPKRRTGRRSRLHVYVKECCQMLELLGIPYLNSNGEAEAYCALLNSKGLVQGVLTDDTDALLYGASTVYKNVSTSKKDSSVICYDMSDIEKHLGMPRDNLIAMALLLGCDYLPDGVPGVGRETVIKLLNESRGVNLLQHFSDWKSPQFDSSGLKPIESLVYKKAMVSPDFPNSAVIQEFTMVKDTIPTTSIQWNKPDYHLLMQFICKHLTWQEEYTREKLIVLLTQWVIRQKQLLHQPGVGVAVKDDDLKPLRILKRRISGGVPILEVEWNMLSSENDATFYTTEITSQFKEAFPVLYAEYDEEETSKKKRKPKKKTHDLQCDSAPTLDDKGPTAERDKYEAANISPAKTISSHQQHDLSSCSDLDDDILPLFRRIQLQPKKRDVTDGNTITHHKANNENEHGTLDFPIVID